MSDPADTIRRYIEHGVNPAGAETALDALLTERDEAVADSVRLGDDLLDALAEQQQALAAVRDRDESLSRWFASYPEDVFPPLSAEQVAKAVEAVQATGITSDALHAAWARHLVAHIMEDIKRADDVRAALADLGEQPK